MAATTDNFRSSLHGFNRMDVVQFIQKTTSEHELELRRLAEERTRQQEELEQQKKELAARQEESERQSLPSCVSRTLRSGRRRSPQSGLQRPFRSRAMMRWS